MFKIIKEWFSKFQIKDNPEYLLLIELNEVLTNDSTNYSKISNLYLQLANGMAIIMSESFKRNKDIQIINSYRELASHFYNLSNQYRVKYFNVV